MVHCILCLVHIAIGAAVDMQSTCTISISYCKSLPALPNSRPADHQSQSTVRHRAQHGQHWHLRKARLVSHADHCVHEVFELECVLHCRLFGCAATLDKEICAGI